MKLSPLRLVAAALLLVTPLAAACGDDDNGAGTDTTVADTTVADTTEADTTVADTTEADTTVADTTEADTTEADTSVADTTAADTTPEDSATGSCDRTGFTAVAEDAGDFLGAFTYIAQSTLDAPVDVLSMELIATNGGPTAAGTYPLTGANYATCGDCVLIYLGCDDELGDCDKTFLAQSGTLDITAFGDSGGRFTGTLTNVSLAEVTVDGDFNSTVVPGGETWCLPSYAFDAEVQ